MVSEREVLSENAASADETLSDEMLSVDTVMADGTGVLPVSPVQRPRKKWIKRRSRERCLPASLW